MSCARQAASAAALFLMVVAVTLFSSPTPAGAQEAEIAVAIAAGVGTAVVNGENRVEADSFKVTITFSEDIGTTFTHSDITASNADTIAAGDLATDTAGLVFTLTIRPTAGFSGDLTLQVGAGVATDTSSKGNAQSNLFTAAVTVKSACITGGAVPATAPDLAGDCAVLLGLHDDLVGTATLSPAWSVSTSIDTWQGITVQDSRVYEIGLSHSMLNGSIPVKLGSLDQVVQLALNENELTGGIPSELGDLANLEGLFLFRNNLSGSIPGELGNLGQLDELSLGDNALTGSIPIQLGSLSRLTNLSLGNNALAGSIPIQLGSLSQLTNLSLGSNQLTGNIPAELGNLTQLQDLDLSDNQLTDEIPAGLGSLSQLETLLLASNQLSGSIPSQLGSLVNLEHLLLHRNMLTGTIPGTLGALAKLRFLHAFDNKLTGSIPMELGMLSKLEDLSLFDNQLSGNIPKQLGNLGSLRQLFLQDNQLDGPIPSDLSRLSSLARLDLRRNQLTGAIPDLSGMPELQLLWLAQNRLTGTIPVLTNLPNLEQLFAHSNQINGQIPDMSGLPKLKRLFLACNQLSGPIPKSLGTVSSLEFLVLLDNDLTGEIPDLTQLTSLQRLLINHNFLEGDFSNTDALINLLPRVSQLIVTLNGNVFVGVDPLTGLVSDLPSWVVATDLASCTPRISFISRTYNGAEGDIVNVVVALGVEQEHAITVPLLATNQDGASNSDYSVPESVTFDIGETEKTVSVSIVQDTDDDDDESVVLGFGTGLPEGVRTVSLVETTVFITDDDDPPITVSFAQLAYDVAEGANRTVTVNLSADPERTVVIPLTATNQGGASGADYSVPTSVTFDTGETTKDITFTAAQDVIDDDGESVLLGFGTLPSGVIVRAITETVVSITDDDGRLCTKGEITVRGQTDRWIWRITGSPRFVGQAEVRLSGDFSVSCAAVQDAPAVVLGVGVAESLAFDGFDDPVRALGGSVGEAAVEVGEQFGLPGPQGAGEAVRLGDVEGAGVVVPVRQCRLGGWPVGAGVEVGEHLFERPGALNFVPAVGSERGVEAFPGGGGEVVAGAQQVAAHRPQRVALAAAVSGEILLAPAAHFGERLGGEALHVEPVRHTGRLGCQVPHGGLVAGVGVDHHRLDLPDLFAERLQAGDQRLLRASLDEVPQPGRVQVHEAGHEAAVAPERGLVDAQASWRTRGQRGDLVACGGGDRPPRRGPAHLERASNRRSRPVPGRPRHRSTQPGGHPPPRGHLDGGLGERTNTARRGATEPALGPHQHRRTLIAQPVSHPLGPILLDPRAEGPTARTRRIGARHAHRHLQPAAALDRAGHLEVLQPGQRTRNITHLGASFSGQLSLPDSRGPDPRPRTLRSQHLPHQPRRAGLPAPPIGTSTQ